jgi:sulfoxide reductase catalytic subunit YedY
VLIRKSDQILYSQVTPKWLYMSRRKFLAGAAASGMITLAGRFGVDWLRPQRAMAAGTSLANLAKSPYSTDEGVTPLRLATSFNNFYEFGSDKSEPARNAQSLRTTPWSVSVEGEVSKPQKFTVDELMKLAPLEERVYRHRCVEGWSVVVPWIGYSLNVVAKLVEPTSKARYVAFESYYDPRQMPWARSTGLDFPYVEGFRMDEAMHPLALLCVGMYGETLPNQDGAPVRLVLPWKYGYKSIKSLTKIRFVSDQPIATWNQANPREYGFYSNVNPTVPNPRYSQATEVRLGGSFLGPRIKTLMFNGYDQVANLYAGMDLRKFY